MLLSALPPRRGGSRPRSGVSGGTVPIPGAFINEARGDVHIAAGQLWTDVVLKTSSLLREFLRFRSESITGLIADASREARTRGRRVALDLFTPSLAPVVGQDYRRLGAHADWVKPMTYRVARGPASLRLEVPALVKNLAGLAGIAPAEAARWCASHVAGLGSGAFDVIDRVAYPSISCATR